MAKNKHDPKSLNIANKVIEEYQHLFRIKNPTLTRYGERYYR